VKLKAIVERIIHVLHNLYLKVLINQHVQKAARYFRLDSNVFRMKYLFLKFSLSESDFYKQ